MEINAKPTTVLNIFILLFSTTSSLFCLYIASISSSWVIILIAIISFSFLNNTTFSLLHEAVHRVFSKNKIINQLCGQWAAMLFPTGLTFQRICHLSHHLRNRTDDEVFDLYRSTDNKTIKYIQFYSIIGGLYWPSVVLGWILYLFFPFSFSIFKNDMLRKQSGSNMMVTFIGHRKKTQIRLELLLTFLFHLSLFYFFNIKFSIWILSYFAFGLNWGALQYADHFLSARSIMSGAWNLKVPWFIEKIFLNYHYHKVHHENPRLPWYYLPRFVDPNSERPSFIETYIKMWKGPKLLTEQEFPLINNLDSEALNDEDISEK